MTITITELGRQIEAAFGRRLYQLGLSIKDMEECGLIEKSQGKLTGEELRALLVTNLD